MPWKKDNPKLIEYRKRYNKKYREANRQYFRDAHNNWAKNNPEKLVERSKKYLQNPENRKKANSRAKVWQAIKSGKLIRPDECSKCLKKCKPEADHADYNKPLDVTWLCKSCHTFLTIERNNSTI